MKKTMFYAECPDHGTAPTLTRTETRYTHISASMVAQGFRAQPYTVEVPVLNYSRGTQAICPSCRKAVPCREVKALDRESRQYGHQCDGRCTGGKRVCDCKCGGLCHGRGECICGKVA